MVLAAGALSQVSVGSTTASLLSAAATGGVGPYEYQWYRSTTSGFSPNSGSLIDGAEALTLNDTGLVPGTSYYFKVVVTDTGASNATATSQQLALVTAAPAQSQNSFSQSPYLGMIDMRFPYNTVSSMVDASENGTLYPGQAVKLVDSAGGVPKVVGITSDTDEVYGFVNYDVKSQGFVKGQPLEMSMSGNIIFLYSVGPIARGEQVVVDLTTRGGVASAAGKTGKRIVGWAYDKAVASGELVRVVLSVPSFEVVGA